jgi:hypothetical protein
MIVWMYGFSTSSRDVSVYARTDEAYGTVNYGLDDATSRTRGFQTSSLHSFDLTHQQLIVRKIGELAKA